MWLTKQVVDDRTSDWTLLDDESQNDIELIYFFLILNQITQFSLFIASYARNHE